MILSLVGAVGAGALFYVFGIVFFLLSAYGLYGAIAYKTGLVLVAFVGYCIKAVIMIIGLIVIVSIIDKDGRYESNGETYEFNIDITALISTGVICK